MTRRQLLGLPFGLAAASCSPAPFRQRDFSVPARSSVGLFAAAAYDADLADVISRGLNVLRVNLRGKRVMLKPNLVEYDERTCINTNAAVVAGAAIALLRHGAESVTVAEGPGHRRDTEYLLASSGMLDALRDLRVPFVDLNHDDVRSVRLRSWFSGRRNLLLPVSLLESDFVVSMPKLKTHHWAGLTCGMKNLFGVVPGAVYGWPKNILHTLGIPQSIVDLAATVRPSLTIVDGITAMEGDGPIMGRPRHMGLIAMGTDVAAVDATCARIIGLDPDKVDYLSMAGRFMGNTSAARIVHEGERPDRFAARFALVERLESLRGR